MRESDLAPRLARATDLRRAGAALAAAILALAALGAAEHAGAPLSLFDLDHDFSVSALLTGALLLAAAGTALLLQKEGAGPAWTFVALVLGALGVEKLGAIHERLEGRFGIEWALSWLPAVVLGGAAACLALWLLRGERRAMLGVAAGAGFWLLAQGLEGFLADGSLAVAVVKELLELAGAATLALALLGVYKARFAGSGVEGGGWGALQELVLSLEPRRVAVVVGAGILVLAAAGAVVGAGVQAHVLDLNAEQTLPALFSGALLVAAGGLALMLWRVAPPGGPHREWWRALAVVFTLLGIDEVAALHEEVQDATGIHPGQLVLLPLVAVAGAAWIATLRYLTGQAAARWLWIGGAGAWALSQAIDATQPRERFVWSVVPEESLEMAGSALFAIALLLLLRSLLVGAAAPGDAGLPGARAPAGAAA